MKLNIRSVRLLTIGLICVFGLSGCANWGWFKKSDDKQSAGVESAAAGASNKNAESSGAKDAEPVIVKEDKDVEISPVQLIDSAAAEPLPAETIAEDKPATPVVSPADKTASIPKDPNTFKIEIQKKGKEHPNFGLGNVMGFSVNGNQGRPIFVTRGQTYTFQVRTNVKHDFYLSRSPQGWGASVYAKGVEGQFTYDGDVTFKPDASTPDKLFYQCRNHKAMGGSIVILNEGEDVKAAEAKYLAERAKKEKANPRVVKKKEVSQNDVKQKVSYVEMLLRFKGKNLSADVKKEVDSKIKLAKKALAGGSLMAAMDQAEQAALLFKSQPKAGLTAEEIADLKADYQSHLDSLVSLVDSHKAAVQSAKKNKEKVSHYDQKEVKKLKASAASLAKSKKFAKARKEISLAERLVSESLNTMLGSKTIVYELKFETPKDEYDYEVKRYVGYLELIPVALEVKKPRPASIKLMESYRKKGEFFAGKAEESIKAGRYEEAIVVIKDATKEVRRGLMILGVSM